VLQLHFIFDGWLGDDIVTTFPCCLASERAAELISKSKLTGVSFAGAEIEQSDLFRQLHPSRSLPPFLWMQIAGEPGVADFGTPPPKPPEMYPRGVTERLVVSSAALAVLKNVSLSNCRVTPFVPATGRFA
jgi:hypothetical protein